MARVAQAPDTSGKKKKSTEDTLAEAIVQGAQAGSQQLQQAVAQVKAAQAAQAVAAGVQAGIAPAEAVNTQANLYQRAYEEMKGAQRSVASSAKTLAARGAGGIGVVTGLIEGNATAQALAAIKGDAQQFSKYQQAGQKLDAAYSAQTQAYNKEAQRLSGALRELDRKTDSTIAKGDLYSTLLSSYMGDTGRLKGKAATDMLKLQKDSAERQIASIDQQINSLQSTINSPATLSAAQDQAYSLNQQKARLRDDADLAGMKYEARTDKDFARISQYGLTIGGDIGWVDDMNDEQKSVYAYLYGKDGNGLRAAKYREAAVEENRVAKIRQEQAAEAARLQAISDRYKQYQGLADWASRSAYQPKNVDTSTGAFLKVDASDDLTYEVINGNPSARNKLIYQQGTSGSALYGDDYSYLYRLTENEKKTYNYLYSLDQEKGGRRAAAYLAELRPLLNQRSRAETEQKMQRYAQENPVAGSAFSVLTAPLKAGTYAMQFADLLGGNLDQNAGANRWSYGNTAIRNKVSKMVEENWGPAGSFFYQTGMSMADFLFNTAITGGSEALSLGLMGTQAAADTVVEAKDRGLNDLQAFSLGTIAGAAEILTEKVSLETLLDKSALSKNAVGYWLKNVLAEGSEEVGSDLINLVADNLISQGKSEWNEAIRAYTAQGLSRQEAFARAFADKAAEMGLSFAGGALSGGVMGAGGLAVNGIANRVYQNSTSADTRMDRARSDYYLAVLQHGQDSPEAAQALRNIGQQAYGTSLGGVQSVFNDDTNLNRKDFLAPNSTGGTGLVYDTYVRSAMDSTVANRINTVAKDLGVRVEFVDQVRQGTANAQLQDRVVQIEKNNQNPTAFLLGHELGHQMKQSAPEAWSTFERVLPQEYQQRVQDKLDLYTERGETITEAEALEEVACDYAGELINSTDVLDRFIQQNRGDRTLLQRIADVVRSIARKLTGAARRQARTAESRLMEAMREAGVNYSSEAETRYSIKNTRNMAFDEQVSGYLSHDGSISSSDSLYVGTSGNSLSVQGIPDSPLYIPTSIVNKALRPQKGSRSGHAMDPNDMYKIQTGIVHADAIVINPSRNAIVYITNQPANNGGRIVVSFDLNNDLYGENAHRATSIHARDSAEGLLNNLDNAARVIVRNKKGLNELLPGTGIQSSQLLATVEYEDNISQSAEKGNPQSGEKTGTVKNSLKESNNESTDNGYSLKRPQNETEKLLRRQERENARLREKLEETQRQLQRTTVKMPSVSQMRAEVRAVMRGYGVRENNGNVLIYREIKQLYELMGNGKTTINGRVWELTSENANRLALEIADQVLSRSRVKEDMAEYQDLRETLKGASIHVPQEIRNDLSMPFQDFKRQYGKEIKFSKDGVEIEMVWQELEEQYPGLFDGSEYLNPADMLNHLGEVLDATRPVESNPFEEGTQAWEIERQHLANDILDRFYEIPQQKPTFADKQYRKLMWAKVNAQNKLAEVKAHYEQRVAAERERGKATTERKVQQAKETAEASLNTWKQRQSNRQRREQIMRHASKLSRELLRPSDSKHIPDALTAPVAKMLESINLESKGGRATKRSEAFHEVRDAYSKIAQDPALNSRMVIDPDLDENLSEVAAMKDTPLLEMSKDQLETVWRCIRGVEASVSNANKLLAETKSKNIEALGESVIAGLTGQREKAAHRLVAGTFDKLLNTDNLNPYDYFHEWGEGGDEIFRMLRNAQDGQTRDIAQIASFTADLLQKGELQDWDTDARPEEVEVFGGKVLLTPAQKMNLYVLMQRAQGAQHILEGGIRPTETKKNRSVQGVRVTELDVKRIGDSLTKRQRQVADQLAEYMKVLSSWGNEVSLRLYGYEKFTEDHYWPIQTDKNFTFADLSADEQEAFIRRQGFTKALNLNARNPVMIGSIFDVFADHAAGMVAYHNYLAVLEDLQRVYNYRSGPGYENSVKQGIEKVQGKNGNEYFRNLIRDINGTAKTDTAFSTKLLSNFKKASVAGNLRVVIQQPTAFFRALAMLDADDITLGAIGRVDWNEVCKYAPIAQWKDWGYFDIGTGRDLKSIILSEGPGSLYEKVEDKMMAPAGIADKVTWARLWKACEHNVAKNNRDLSRNSVEFKQKVGALFSEMIDRTQVVDSVLHRSQIMRSKNGLNQISSAFMAEPIKSYNLMRSCLRDLARGRSGAGKKLTRAAVALLLNVVFNGAAQSFIDALRDDDDDETYWEKWLQAFTGLNGDEVTFGDYMKAALSSNVVDGLNPLGWIPYIKDLYSMVQGYTVGRMDLDAASDIVNSAQRLVKAISGEGKTTIDDAIIDFGSKLARLLGSSAGNVYRDVKSIAQTVQHQFIDDPVLDYRVETFAPIADALSSAGIENVVTAQKSRLMDILYRTAVEGDELAYKTIQDDMLTKGYTYMDIRAAMKDRFKKDWEKDESIANNSKLMDFLGITRENIAEWKRNAFESAWNKDHSVADDADAMRAAGVTEDMIADWEETEWKASGYIEDLKALGANLDAAENTVRKIKNATSTYQKWKALGDSKLKPGEKDVLMRVFAGDNDIERWEEIQETGLSIDDFIMVKMQHLAVSNVDLDKAGEKALKFYHWIDSQGFTTDQAAALKDSFIFFQMTPASAGKYDKFADAGIQEDIAYQLTGDLNSLKPLEGKDSVSAKQQQALIAFGDYSADTKLKALTAIMDDNQSQKLKGAMSAGIGLDAYMDYYLNGSNFTSDKDASGNDIQGGEARAKTMTFVDGIPGLTNAQKNYLVLRPSDGGIGKLALSTVQKEAPWYGGSRYTGSLPEHGKVSASSSTPKTASTSSARTAAATTSSRSGTSSRSSSGSSSRSSSGSRTARTSTGTVRAPSTSSGSLRARGAGMRATARTAASRIVLPSLKTASTMPSLKINLPEKLKRVVYGTTQKKLKKL